MTVNHHAYNSSTFSHLRQSIDELDTDARSRLADTTAFLCDELSAQVEEAEARANRLSGLLLCIPRLLAWRHRALTAYYAPQASGFKRLRAEYEAEAWT